MYREMRRKDRRMDRENSLQLLEKGEYGILSTVGEDGQPYATPLNYVLLGETVYFHCALTGQKLDNLLAEPRVCFCVVGETQPVYDKDFTTYYESVVAYGRAAMEEDPVEKGRVLTALCEKYLPEHMDKAPESIRHSQERTGVVKIPLEHITGKEKTRQ